MRQRALLREHLAWLDRQIDEEERKSPVTAPLAPPAAAKLTLRPQLPASSPAPAVAIPAAEAPPVLADTSAADAAAESILEEYRAQQATVVPSVKRGCYAYFFLAMFFFVGLIVLFYYYVKMRQGR